MKNLLKKEHIENALNSYAKECKELKNLVLHDADIRTGKKLALARKGFMGSISVVTDFMTYAEMNQFLRGYYFSAIGKFNTNKGR